MKIEQLFSLTPFEDKIDKTPFKEKIEEIVDGFLNKSDWRVYENANRAKTYYSLLSHIVQHAIAIYSLDKLPKNYAYGHKTGWWHIHDLGISGVFIRYCSGLDMQKFLVDGFKNILPNTATSTPPKHFATVLDHLLNFFTIFSHECYDKDTEILTENGWKKFYELDKNEKVATFNIETKKFEFQLPTRYIAKEPEFDKQIFIKGLDLIVTPLHPLLIYDEKSNNFTYKTAIDLYDMDKIGRLNGYKILITNESINFIDYFDLKGHFDLIEYKDKVYCVTVPNNNIVIRKNNNILISSNCAGAVAVSSLDVYCAPYIYKDRFYYAELLSLDPYSEQMNKFIRNYVYQSLQRFIWNLNYPLRAGFEALFTNITLDISAKKSGLAERQCIWYGKTLEDLKYKDLQEEVNLFNECLLDIKAKGQPNGTPFTFPIITINLTDDFDKILTPKLKELIYLCSAKYGEFYFQNCINGELGLEKINPDDVRSFCCHLNLRKDEIYRRVGGFFSGGENVGSICVTTLNLPRYAFVARKYFSKDKNNIEEIMENFEKILDICFEEVVKGAVKRKELILKHSTLKYDLAPFIKNYEDPHMRTYFITIGFLGLHEALINMGLKLGLSNENNIKYGERIMKRLLENIKKYQEKYDTLINLEATPAEGAGTRLAKLDKKYFYK